MTATVSSAPSGIDDHAVEAERTRSVADEPPSDHRRGGRGAWVACLALLLVVYVALYGWLLVATDGVPYVYDNNESYSSLWHAANLANFSFFESAGLTDEAYGPNPDAHPYVHTHQGNFPRLFAFLIYVLGARTIESQIALTTFTVGTVAVVLMYSYFARLAGAAFALVAGLVFLTDYLFFAQWQVVTYRVWHPFFLFAALLCVYGIGGSRRRRWTILTFALYACLFYYELIFAAFVAIFAGLYTAWVYRHDLRTILHAWAVQAGGGWLAIGVLLAQLTAHFGLRVALEDLYITFFARNLASRDPSVQDRLDTFFRSHNIVFWYNVVDVSGYRTWDRFVGLLYAWHFQVYTPLFVLLVLVILVGWILGLAVDRVGPLVTVDRHGLRFRLGGRLDESPLRATFLLSFGTTTVPDWLPAVLRADLSRAMIVLAFLGVPSLLFVVTLFRDTAYLGTPVTGASFVGRLGWVGFGALCGIVALVGLLGLLGRRTLARLSLGRAFLGGALIFGTALYVRYQSGLYLQPYAPLWYTELTAWVPESVSRAAVVGVLAFALGLTLAGARRALGAGPARHLAAVLPFLVLGFAAFAITYLLSPGYVYSGYMIRSAPMIVFFADVAIAVAMFVVLAATVRAVGRLRVTAAPHARPTLLGRVGRVVAPIGLAGLAAFVVGFWLHLNVAYVGLVPPTHFAFLKDFGQPPYLGASVASNTYAAPIAWYTQQWAYIDTTLGNGNVRLTNDGYEVAQELQTYLWLADKRTNPEYREPAYYVCMRQQGLLTVLQKLKNELRDLETCKDVPIVARAAKGSSLFLQPRIVARDPTELDSWAIVKLDWDYPPYLRPLDAAPTGRNVLVDASPAADGTMLTPRYEYAQQKGAPPADPLIRAYGVRRDGSRCLISEQQGQGAVWLPADLVGEVQLGVTPRTATKDGPEYLSARVTLGDRGARSTVCDGR